MRRFEGNRKTSGIISYLKEKGGDTFERRPFCEVDSLILSQMAYPHYDGFVSGEPSFRMTLGDLRNADGFERIFKNVRAPGKNAELFEAAARSERFGAVRLGMFVNEKDIENEKQFAAITFLLPDGTYYIAFRGTDASVIGWKEDLNMAFMRDVPAQRSAARYFSSAAENLKGRLILGGHSKGGNLAVYAAMSAGENYARINGIYNHDGPGFRNDVFGLEAFKTVSPIVNKTIPQTSIVGLLLEQHEDFKVIKSDAVGFMQHDPFSWIVEDGNFVCLDGISGFSRFTNAAINDWLNALDDARREAFVNALYGIIEATDAATIPELFDNWRKNAGSVLNAMRSCDPEVRKLLTGTMGELMRSAANEMKSLVGERVSEMEAAGKKRLNFKKKNESPENPDR